MTVVDPDLASFTVGPRGAFWFTVSFGQVTSLPVQNSAGSQAMPEEGRHSVPAGYRASAGQSPESPLQLSAGSQAPSEARHSVPPGTTTSAGQAGDTPSQASATSQPPAEGRHSVPAFMGALTQPVAG